MTVPTSRSPSGSKSFAVTENVTSVSSAVDALSSTATGGCSPGGGGGGGDPTETVTVAVSSPP